MNTILEMRRPTKIMSTTSTFSKRASGCRHPTIMKIQMVKIRQRIRKWLLSTKEKGMFKQLYCLPNRLIMVLL